MMGDPRDIVKLIRQVARNPFGATGPISRNAAKAQRFCGRNGSRSRPHLFTRDAHGHQGEALRVGHDLADRLDRALAR